MPNISIRSRIGEIIQSIRYSLKYRKRQSINIYTWDKTIDEIKQNNLSLSRFGDGEILIVLQYLGVALSNSTFQDFDQNLGKRLYSILSSDKSDAARVLVGLPRCMFGGGVDDMIFGSKYFWERFSADWIELMLTVLKKDKIYADTNMTRFYYDFKDKSILPRAKAKRIKELWKGRDVIVVEGQQTRMGVGNDLFDNVSSLRRVLVPTTNAFAKYDKILATVKGFYAKGDLILIAAGMTATVLAYDLSALGCQALDIGHIDIEYEWMKRGALTREKIPGKFTNEASNKFAEDFCKDSEYLHSIISSIE